MTENHSLDEFATDPESPSSTPEADCPQTSNGVTADPDDVPAGSDTAEPERTGTEDPPPNPSDGGDEPQSVPPTESAVEPVSVTSAWTPAGCRCESCGTVVERRWVHADQYVCTDCKDW